MPTTATRSIREIAAEQPSAAKIFERFEIDLCTLADKSLTEACCKLRLSLDQLLEKLEEGRRTGTGASAVDPADLSLAQLIQRIVRTHHQRVRQDLPGLSRLAHKLAEKRRKIAPELIQVENLIERLHKDMLAHIGKEEQVLFPFMVQMEENSSIAYPPAHSCFTAVSHPIFMMVQEHELASSIILQIRKLTRDFELPAGACPTHRALFDGLREFDVDLRQHTHLENDVLFPRAIQMEANLHSREQPGILAAACAQRSLQPPGNLASAAILLSPRDFDGGLVSTGTRHLSLVKNHSLRGKEKSKRSNY